MNRKKDFTEDFAEIQNMCSKIRTINESLSFNEDDYGDEEDYGYGYGDEGEEMPQQGQQQMPQQDQQPMMQGQQGQEEDPEDAEVESELQEDGSPINKIREIALKGMVRLCKTPEDPQYEVLKKVFTMIDKANDKKNEEQQQ